MTNELKSVPEPTLRRLPIYLQLLKELQKTGWRDISTTHIAGELKLDPTQVRKDLAYTGIVGKPKVGYDIDVLAKGIEDFLNWNNLTDAFLAGAGNLGQAIIGYEGFKKYGVNIIAAFDVDSEKIGQEIHGISILPLEKLPDLANRMHIHIGILTVPAEQAQKTAELMIQGGIKAIWNFAPVSLRVPDDVIVESAGFTTSLAVLTRRLAEKLR